MADFLQAFESMIRNEGGYKLHSVEGDRGGMTYAGIARNFHPNWPGWAAIDAGDIPDTELVRQFLPPRQRRARARVDPRGQRDESGIECGQLDQITRGAA